MTDSPPRKPVVVGISGATGMAIAQAVVDGLLAARVPVALVVSNASRQVWVDEMDEPLAETLSRWDRDPLFTHYGISDFRAPISSGTVQTAGMAVVPCSMATVAAVAHGMVTNLLHRAADVHLKERRPLVIVPREAPLSAIHLDNLARLAHLGVTVLPPMPAFYLRPTSVDDIVRFVAQKVLVALGVRDALDPNFVWSKDGER